MVSPVFKSADNESGDTTRDGVTDVRLYEKPPPPLGPPEYDVNVTSK